MYLGSLKVKDNSKIYLSRLILGVNDTTVVDHKDGDKLNNREYNLRNCSQQQNTMNTRKRKTTSSRYKGVSLDKRSGKWHAYITINGKRKSLGYFVSEEMARDVYDRESKEYHGEYGKINEMEW